jgi:hypothetical protein
MNRHAHRPFAECPKTLKTSPIAPHFERGARADDLHAVGDGVLTRPTVGPRHPDVWLALSIGLSDEARQIVADTDLATGPSRAFSARELLESTSGRMLDPVQLKSFRKSPTPTIAREKRQH